VPPVVGVAVYGRAMVEDPAGIGLQPVAQRPIMPDGYGVPATTSGLAKWSDVEQRLISAQTYWLATTRPDGRPHVVPRWGVWLEGRFWYDGSPTTRHAVNLAANPACALHLASDDLQAVIVEGRSDPTRAPADGLGSRLAHAYAKYHSQGYAPEPDAWAAADGGGLRVLTPHRALAWFAFPADCTRFSFAGAAPQ
jgi:nitroimidazol reductase NimA-like FMN-containing flavoprotein (pyridoxamine 5'-phosphate oxidase superfamily)